MSQSSRLALAYLAPLQSQKHVTVNESLRKLDALVQLAVKSKSASAQPAAPADGDCYILPSGKTGAAWGAMTNYAVAYYVDGAWTQLTPREGWIAYIQDTDVLNAYDGSAWNSVSSASVGRELLTANRTYYVRTDGNDSNNGLANTSGGAFLTIQKAVDVVAALDIAIYAITVQVANGTYASAVAFKDPLGSGTCTLQGDTTTPSNVVVSVTGSDALKADKSRRWTVAGVKVQTTTSGNCVKATTQAALKLNKVDFGASAGYHMTCDDLSTLDVVGNYTISGAAGAHIAVGNNSLASILSGLTVTLTGTPAIGVFAHANRSGSLTAHGLTFSGSATGTRYTSISNGIIYVAGAASTYFPGNAAGSTSTGGLYY